MYFQQLRNRPLIFIFASTMEDIQNFRQARGIPDSIDWADLVLKHAPAGANLDHHETAISTVQKLIKVIEDRSVPYIHHLCAPATVMDMARSVGPGRERSVRTLIPSKAFFLADEVWWGGTDGWYDTRNRTLDFKDRLSLEQIRDLAEACKEPS